MTLKNSKYVEVAMVMSLLMILGSVAVMPSYGYLNKNQPTSLYIVISPTYTSTKVNSTTRYTISTFENSTLTNVSLNITLDFYNGSGISYVMNISYTNLFTGMYQFSYKANMSGFGVFTVKARYKDDFSNETASIYVNNGNQFTIPSYSLIGYVLPYSNISPGGNVSVQGYIYYNSSLTHIPSYSSLSVQFAPTYYTGTPDYTTINSNVENTGYAYWVNFSIPKYINESGTFYLGLEGQSIGIFNTYLFTYNFYNIWAKYTGNTVYIGAYWNNGSAIYNASVSTYLSNNSNNLPNLITGKTNDKGIFAFNITNTVISKIYGFVNYNGYRQGFSISLLGQIPVINFEKDQYGYSDNVYMLYGQSINNLLNAMAYFNNSILSNTNIYYMVYLSPAGSNQQNYIVSGKTQTNQNGLFSIPININLNDSNILKDGTKIYTIYVILRVYISNKICNLDYDKDVNGTYFTTIYMINYIDNPYVGNMSVSSYSISNGFIHFTLKAPQGYALAPINILMDSNMGTQIPLVGGSVGIKQNASVLVSSPVVLPRGNTYTVSIYVPPLFKNSSYNVFAYGITIEGNANNVHSVLLTWNYVISQDTSSTNIPNIIMDGSTVSLMAIAGGLIVAILILVVIGKKKQMMDKYRQQGTSNLESSDNMQQQNMNQSEEYQQPPLQP
ncbi:MAG: hypothetical protein ACP5RS_03160 [Thermoplasmata archaeon]